MFNWTPRLDSSFHPGKPCHVAGVFGGRKVCSCPVRLSRKSFFPSLLPGQLLFLTLILFCSSHLQSTRVEFDLPEYSVRRRYQDFDWLRNKLEESQPTHLIPVGTKSVQLVTHFSFFLFPDCSLNSHPSNYGQTLP